MRNQINVLPIVFWFLVFGCGSKRETGERPNVKPPKIVEAKTYRVPLEKAVPPNVVPASGIKKIVAGKPETVHLKSNVFSAKPTRVLLAGPLKLILPNGEVYRLPKVVHAIDSLFIAGAPKIILMKDLFIKENNPESFSSTKAMHGLNSNDISSLCEDKAGNLWIGAWWGGVSKYDGRYLTNYYVNHGLSSDVVHCVLEDKSGNIWIGTTDAGVKKFDGKYITRLDTFGIVGFSEVNFTVKV